LDISFNQLSSPSLLYLLTALKTTLLDTLYLGNNPSLCSSNHHNQDDHEMEKEEKEEEEKSVWTIQDDHAHQIIYPTLSHLQIRYIFRYLICLVNN